MRKYLLILLLGLAVSSSLHSQLAVLKMIGKNSGNSKIGFGTFLYYNFPVNEIGNNSVMIELLDLGFFPPKNPDTISMAGYLSIKVGFKHIFSEESKTGFYVEPSIGYGGVVVNINSTTNDVRHDGIALALEGGYNLEVGQRDNTLVFGLKYESDLAGAGASINAIGFRVSYSFHLFRSRRND